MDRRDLLAASAALLVGGAQGAVARERPTADAPTDRIDGLNPPGIRASASIASYYSVIHGAAFSA